jgi:hypothetical protein
LTEGENTCTNSAASDHLWRRDSARTESRTALRVTPNSTQPLVVRRDRIGKVVSHIGNCARRAGGHSGGVKSSAAVGIDRVNVHRGVPLFGPGPAWYTTGIDQVPEDSQLNYGEFDNLTVAIPENSPKAPATDLA